jgi:hypothetical protein
MQARIRLSACLKIDCLMIAAVAVSTAAGAQYNPVQFDVAKLSEGRMAYAGSTQNGHDPTNVVDDNAAPRWNAIDGTYPQWWMVDLGKSADLTAMQIQWYQGASGSDHRVIDLWEVL